MQQSLVKTVILDTLKNTHIEWDNEHFAACKREFETPRVDINAPPTHYSSPNIFVGGKRINPRAEFYKLGRNYSAKMFIKALAGLKPTNADLGISIYVKNTDLSAMDIGNVQAVLADRKLPTADPAVLKEHAWSRIILACKDTIAMLTSGYFYKNRTDDITRLLGAERMQMDKYKWLSNYREIPINVANDDIGEAIRSAIYMQILMGEHENGCLNICFNGYLPVFMRYDYVAYNDLKTAEYRLIVENTGDCVDNPALKMRDIIAGIITTCYKSQSFGEFVMAGCELKYAYKSFAGKPNPKAAVEYTFKVHYRGYDEILYIIDWCGLNQAGFRFSNVLSITLENEISN
ncbi:hypothetical protein F-S17_0058 [Faustovirus]|nr:hypothetical protein F-M6_0074 [Faustovirus]QJX72324.1 hypothetical protein F-S17_0058 [Faustovirus]QJX72834.1 hypothetical protein F-VV57_0072 [Faustovirus]QJX73340.1 hypothetical protein F-VV63_0074 [Faustovirus]